MKKLFWICILGFVFLGSSLQAFNLESVCILKTTISGEVFYINLQQVTSISHKKNNHKHLNIRTSKGNQYLLHISGQKESDEILDRYQSCLIK
ncbi:MAG: hypothetical protein HRT43_11215 [Campylobacteraceae bacterium]|nr:hypothetical protein [Campylobacteraceae bacterium]